MRIIAGSRKSLKLKTIPGDRTRPTTDRIKETLFNMIGPWLAGSRFLDIFAGSGGIGLEALSRGAAHACFVEKNRAALSVIRQNIQYTRFDEFSEVIAADALKFFSSAGCSAAYDILFMDPPYRMGYEKAVIDSIRNSGWITRETLCIAETAIDDETSWTRLPYVELDRVKTYKTNQHLFFHIKNGE